MNIIWNKRIYHECKDRIENTRGPEGHEALTWSLNNVIIGQGQLRHII